MGHEPVPGGEREETPLNGPVRVGVEAQLRHHGPERVPPESRRGHERGRPAGGGGSERRQLRTQGPIDYGPVGARHGQARARPLHALDTERNDTTSHNTLTPNPGGGGRALTPRGGVAVREGCRDRVGHRRDRVTARSAIRTCRVQRAPMGETPEQCPTTLPFFLFDGRGDSNHKDRPNPQ